MKYYFFIGHYISLPSIKKSNLPAKLNRELFILFLIVALANFSRTKSKLLDFGEMILTSGLSSKSLLLFNEMIGGGGVGGRSCTLGELITAGNCLRSVSSFPNNLKEIETGVENAFFKVIYERVTYSSNTSILLFFTEVLSGASVDDRFLLISAGSCRRSTSIPLVARSVVEPKLTIL